MTVGAGAALPEFFFPRDLLQDYAGECDLAEVQRLRAERLARLDRPHWQSLLRQLRELEPRVESVELARDAVTALGPDDAAVAELARRLIPWRKGPFDLCGTEIDAEWRSERKWNRLAPFVGDFAGQRVCDVGCGNGYYMFRAAASDPRLLLGFDPSEHFFLQYHLVQRLLGLPRVQFEMLGAEHLEYFPGFFDRVLCWGIVYHQRHPLRMVRQVFEALRPGGMALIESMGIPGDEPLALSPPGRYAKARNVFFVPTGAALVAWMERCGFRDVELISSEATTCEEQRATDWMLFESLADFLDADDPSRTVEGWPAPLRIAVRGWRS